MNANTRKFKTEIDNAVKVCLSYYLATTHSETIVAIYSYKTDDYFTHEMTSNELYDAVCINSNSKGELQIALRGTNAKRAESYNASCKEFCKAEELETLKTEFPEGLSSGYIAEFLYRIKEENEKLEDIKKMNNSKSYYKASDTKSGKQIKKLDKNGASLASLKLILKAAEEKLKEYEELKNAVEFLNRMYKEEN